MLQERPTETFRINTPPPDPSKKRPGRRKRPPRDWRHSLPLLGMWVGLLALVGGLALVASSDSSPVPTAQAAPPVSHNLAPANPTTAFLVTIPPFMPTPTPIQVNPTPTPAASLETVIKGIAENLKDSLGKNAEFGLLVHNLETGEQVAINGQKLFETASLYKLFVMLTVYQDISQGKLSLDTNITLTSEIASYSIEEDAGVLIVPIGQSMAVRDLLHAMIVNSNNTASLMLLFQVRAAHMRQLVADMGFKGADLSNTYKFQATPEDFDQFFTRLADQKLLGPASDPAMLELTSRQPTRDRIGALLPPTVRFANKTGNFPGVTNDTGLVYLPNGQRLSITVLTRQSDWNSARKFISQIGLAAYNYYIRG